VSRPARPLASLPPVERARSLDALHRQRTPGIWGRVFRLRYLASALQRFSAGTEPVEALPVPRPEPGLVSVTFVGHATAMVTSPRSRLLVDPLFETSFYGIRRAQEAGIAADDREDVDLVLITHAHRDHLSRTSLRRLPRGALLVVPPGCASLVSGLGFAEVIELAPGQQHAHADVEVAGDIVYFSGFAEIGRRLQPDVALLPIAGYDPVELRDEHLSPLDACCAFEDLRARIFIPTSYGAFPLGYEPLDAPLAWLRQLARERDWARADSDQRVAILDAGQTVHVRMRA
jgi:L-ascorbate metabolism protein UlaG (beta-lactamase superfamily)